MVDINKRINNFNKRFNIDYAFDNEEKFKNLILNAIVKCIGASIENNQFKESFFKYACEIYDKRIIIKNSAIFDFDNPFGKTIKPEDAIIYKKIMDSDCFNKTIFYLQSIFWMNSEIISNKTKESFYNDIVEAIKISGVNIRLNCINKNNEKEYIFYPSGAKELDEKLVNNVLEWLSAYEGSRAKLISAIEKYQKNGDVRNIIDDLRLSLELFLKQVLNSEKVLKNSKTDIGKWLQDKNVHVNIRGMYTTLLNFYDSYQNSTVKHNEMCKEQEVEFVLYLTGSFIRFIITLDKGNVS